ncbi:hypothetical protein HMPREF1634_07330 [Tissierellia bacterium S7-1-4]|nr:hypothetical protein HMPREF1634_07330 [Tissierellia bacterium S7-1-4]
MIRTWKNAFHNRNVYIDFEYDDLKDEKNDPFREIYIAHGVPLQFMVDSSDTLKRDIAKTWGFKKMRSCYSLEVTKDDLISHENRTIKICEANLEDEIYENLSKIYFDYYRNSHEAINPVSASFNEFKEILPDKIYFSREGGMSFAFIEKNEIAYVYSDNLEIAGDFFRVVAEMMFCDYDTIFFEADDVDECAMRLKNIFSGGLKDVFETWIYDLEDVNN